MSIFKKPSRVYFSPEKKLFESLHNILGFYPTTISLYKLAFRHSSASQQLLESGIKNSNERLEFLGDAVLELVVSENLFHNYENPEGELTSFRAALVNGDMLAKIGSDLGLQHFLLMSRGESKDTGRARSYLVANAMEAVIGALYLDQGYDAAKNFILEQVMSHLPEVFEHGLHTDAKSRFQEI